MKCNRSEKRVHEAPRPVCRVPDCVKDKGVRLSRAERRARKEKQMSFGSIEAFPEYSGEREGK